MHELKNPEARIRNEALRILIERKTEKARKMVIPLLNDPDDEVVHSALAFVLELKCEEAVPDLIKLLDHPNSSIRMRAASALAPIAGKTAGPNLMKALKDPNPRVKTTAALGLCQMDFAEARDEIVKIMQEDSIKSTRRAFAVYLRYLKSAPACDALVQMLSDKDERLVCDAIYSLGELQCEDAVMPLLDSLKANPRRGPHIFLKSLKSLKANPGRAPHIFPALARIGNAEAEKALKELFHNTAAGSENKTNAAIALAEMGDPTGIPYLREGPITNINVAMRMARAGEYSAVPTLLPKLQQGNPANRYFYGKVLEELTGKNYGWDYKKWKKWWEKNKDELLEASPKTMARTGGV
jgi:HEAT repeat protein